MGTPFENFVNLELPRRPALLTYEITNYQGDPNSVSAPDILKDAPKGTFYLRNTDASFWRKQTPVWNSWIDVAGGVNTNTFEATCSSTNLVGDLVRVVLPGLAVSGTNIANRAEMPVAGVIISKISTTLALVQTHGLVKNVFAGLQPGKIYFNGADSRPTATPPQPVVGQRLFIQTVGIALSANILKFEPSTDIKVRRG